MMRTAEKQSELDILENWKREDNNTGKIAGGYTYSPQNYNIHTPGDSIPVQEIWDTATIWWATFDAALWDSINRPSEPYWRWLGQTLADNSAARDRLEILQQAMDEHLAADT